MMSVSCPSSAVATVKELELAVAEITKRKTISLNMRQHSTITQQGSSTPWGREWLQVVSDTISRRSHANGTLSDQMPNSLTP